MTTTIRTMAILCGWLTLSGMAWASGECSSCTKGIEVKFMMEEDINGSFSVTLNSVKADGNGYDTNEMSRTSWGKRSSFPMRSIT